MSNGSSPESLPRPSATARWATPHSGRETLAPALADVAEMLGTPLMPWQRQVAEVALEHDATGRLAYRDAVITVPRQSGKTVLLLSWIVFRMVAQPLQRLAYGAQSRVAARSKLLDDWWPLLARSPLAGLFQISRVNGGEALRCNNGSMLVLLSGDESSGHGSTFDMVALDEVWALDHRVEQAVRPTMVTKRNAQLIMVSTAGSSKSAYWREKVESGRTAAAAGLVDGLCFFEWSAAPDADMGDPKTWWDTMPALGLTVDESVIRADFMSMAPAEFARAYGNRWSDDATDQGWDVFDRDKWNRALL